MLGLRLRKVVLGILFFGFGSYSWAGWTSGGGSLIQDARNPWFLDNTKIVRYCISQDRDYFHQTESVISDAVREAIDYWLEEFKNAKTWEPYPKIATNTFIQVGCDQAHDLQFQFGHLSGEQIRQLGDPTKIIATSVRTSYDENLKATGFIYVSADSGPLKPSFEHVVDMPWSGTGDRIWWILVHEMGHIFGLQHNPQDYIMSERFAEKLISKDGQYDWPRAKLPYFKFRESGIGDLLMCYVESDPKPKMSLQALLSNKPLSFSVNWRKLLGVPEDSKCFGYNIRNGNLVVMAGRTSDTIKTIGTASVKLTEDAVSILGDPVVQLYVPEKQNVIPKEIFGRSRLVDLAFKKSRENFKGNYQTNDGSIKRVVFGVLNTAFIQELSTVENGDVLLNFLNTW